MSKNHDGSVLVFDIEGTDSKERGEQRMVSNNPKIPYEWCFIDLNLFQTDL